MFFFTDTSYFQVPGNDRYKHRWISFRSNDGTFRDPEFFETLHWAKTACARGATKTRRVKARLTRKAFLRGYTVYLVFRPGADNFDTLRAMVGKPDRFITVMIDVESWAGQIRGDHSQQITNLAEHIATWLGSKKRVLVYANGGDFENIYPHRPSWLRRVVASYGSQYPGGHNVIAWQYSDGENRYPVPAGYPRSSAPFGHCDHNVAFAADAGAFAHMMGLPGTVAPRKPAPPAHHEKHSHKPAPHKTPKFTTHIVVRGDELGQLAHHYRTSVSQLIKWNAKRYPKIKASHGDFIKPGWSLRVSR